MTASDCTGTGGCRRPSPTCSSCHLPPAANTHRQTLTSTVQSLVAVQQHPLGTSYPAPSLATQRQRPSYVRSCLQLPKPLPQLNLHALLILCTTSGCGQTTPTVRLQLPEAACPGRYSAGCSAASSAFCPPRGLPSMHLFSTAQPQPPGGPPSLLPWLLSSSLQHPSGPCLSQPLTCPSRQVARLQPPEPSAVALRPLRLASSQPTPGCNPAVPCISC